MPSKVPALTAFLLVASATRALAADPLPFAKAEPLEMAADKLDLDVEAKTALLTGHVKLTRGPLTVACPRVDVRYDEVPHVTWVRGSGGVHAEVKGVTAEAPEAELDVGAQALELKGGVRLTRGEGWITADRASIQLATGKVSLTDVKGSIPLSPPLPSAALTALLAAERLTVRLGGAMVLRGVGLEVAAGEVLGIFGPSGAGKSTLFRALAGEPPRGEGRVLLAGEDVTRLPLWARARRGLGYVPQTPSVLVNLTVAENLAVYAALAPAGRGLDPRALAVELGLEGRLAVAAGSLSGGERRRLEIARALSAGPRVLLCDEPFAAIDPAGAARVAERLGALARAGAAVVIADHHAAFALRLCHRAALLLEGEVAVVAPPGEFIRHPAVRKHYAILPDTLAT